MLSLSTSFFVAICLYLSVYSVQATVFMCNRTISCGCSRNNANINARIVGGEIAASHSWGWAVSLRMSPTRNMCGGTIVSRNYILTAAHCVNDIFVASMLTVVVGADTILGNEGQKIQVATIIMHPGYNPLTNENDIALLLLRTPINFGDANVAKICLPSVLAVEQYRYPIVNKPLVAIGWGTLSSGGSAPDTLRQVTVKAVDSDAKTCKPSIRNTRLQFCAAVNGGGKDTCQGDSGGPLMFYSNKERSWVLAGITSYGRGCGLRDHAGVYTRVSVYIGWIRSIIGNDGMVTILQSKANIPSMSILMIFVFILFHIVQ